MIGMFQNTEHIRTSLTQVNKQNRDIRKPIVTPICYVFFYFFCTGVRNRKKASIKIKYSFKVTNLAKIKYRLDFVLLLLLLLFSYEGLQNTLFCIISIGPSARGLGRF